MARCSALLLLAVLFAAASTLTLAFAPGAAVGRQGGLATAFWGRVWGPKQQQQQLALGRLMATRGGVAGGKVKELRTLAETEEALEAAGNKLVVIDFTATWCGPCKLIGPIFESLSDEISESDAVFLKVDVDENGETAQKFDVMQMPTFLFVKNGEVQGRLVGANPDKLREAVFSRL